MAYKVKPFIAKVSNKGSTEDVAYQVEAFIEKESMDGWKFLGCGNIHTNVAGTNGCFGIGATPGTSTSVMVIIFGK